MAVALLLVGVLLACTAPFVQGWSRAADYWELYYPIAGFWMKLSPLIWFVTLVLWGNVGRWYLLKRRSDKRLSCLNLLLCKLWLHRSVPLPFWRLRVVLQWQPIALLRTRRPPRSGRSVIASRISRVWLRRMRLRSASSKPRRPRCSARREMRCTSSWSHEACTS